MKTKKPIRFKGIKELLTIMNLEDFQKIENFHIIKFEDHPRELSKEFFGIPEDCFSISISKSMDVTIGINGEKFQNNIQRLSFVSPGQSVYISESKVVGKGLGFLIFFKPNFLQFTPTYFSIIQKFPYYSIHSKPVYFIDEESYHLFYTKMEKIYTEFKNLDQDNIEIIQAYLTIILFETKKLLKTNVLNNSNKNRAEEVTYQFETLLKSTEQKKQKLSFYASKLNISDVYLSECVKKTTGSSAKKLMSEYILYEAKYLLSISSNKLDTIALKLGFKETPNFISFFKKNTSFTPNQYRKSLDEE
ncbi:helix-turn-helix domain-containing protein [Aureivirga sp. CE67]|uniref:helix-turn-helix domain-containing protein n=1 Tax=Aureivirga sp. CE67 TaxID=1788983 RepID=UPI0018CA0AB6|nr:AraC family transcriptional regulator [Aureivirga sp. CE67]